MRVSTTHIGSKVEYDENDPRSAYLDGAFAPVGQEVTAFDLEVEGSIPKELVGRFLRVGSNPNPFDPEDPRTYSWFTGSGMVFGVRLREGRAEWYRNRFVRDDVMHKSLGIPRLPGPEQLAHRPQYVDETGPKFVDNNIVNTNVLAVGGRTYAFAEAGVLPIELSYELESVERTDFGGTLNGSFTGHPHRDPDTGDLHGLSYYWQWDHVSYQVLGNDGIVKQTIDVPVDGNPTVHDMAITETYAAFLDGPLQFSPEAHAKGFEYPYAWDTSASPQWVLVRRDGSGIIRCDAPFAMVFHILNAFDLPDGRVAIDACTYAGKVFDQDLSGPVESQATLQRHILDPATGRCVVEQLDDRPQEMPRLDERRTGREHRYAYLTGRRGTSAIFKHDLQAGTSVAYEHGPGRVGIETVFVPREGSTGEDDGYLMTHVLDMPSRTSEMLVFHSQTLEEGPMARVRIPHLPNTGFHGNWIPDAELTAFNGA